MFSLIKKPVFRPPTKIILAAIGCLLCAPYPAAHAAADPDQVNQVINSETSLFVETDQQKTQRRTDIDAHVAEEMQKLGTYPGCTIASLPDSDPSVVTLKGQIEKEIEAAAWMLFPFPHEDELMRDGRYIARNGEQADVDQLLSFYQSPEGQRYQAFRAKINALIGQYIQEDAQNAVREKSFFQNISAGINKALHGDAIKHVQIMRLFADFSPQSANSGQPDVAMDGLINEELALNHTDQFEALYDEYKDDFPAFEQFRLAPAYNHFFSLFHQIETTPSLQPAMREIAWPFLEMHWRQFCISLLSPQSAGASRRQIYSPQLDPVLRTECLPVIQATPSCNFTTGAQTGSGGGVCPGQSLQAFGTNKLGDQYCVAGLFQQYPGCLADLRRKKPGCVVDVPPRP